MRSRTVAVLQLGKIMDMAWTPGFRVLFCDIIFGCMLYFCYLYTKIQGHAKIYSHHSLPDTLHYGVAGNNWTRSRIFPPLEREEC